MSAPALAGAPAGCARLEQRTRVRVAPPWQPPYDDEIPPVALRLVGDELPFDGRPPAQRLTRPEEPQWAGLPDPRSWARPFLQAALETAAGRRPPRQLERWTTPAVFNGLSRTGARVARSGPRPAPVIRAMRAMEPVGGVAEVSAVVVRKPGPGARVGAVALRLEAHHGRWRCVVLQIG